MGRKARLKAQRRKVRRRRRSEYAAVRDDLKAIDGVVIDVLSGCRERGLRGGNILQFLGAVLCCWGEGMGFDELRGRVAEDPRLDEQLQEWTKCALASLASLTRNAAAHVRADADWALGEIGVDVGALGLTWGASRGKSDEVVVRECVEAIGRMDDVVSAVWGAARKGRGLEFESLRA